MPTLMIAVSKVRKLPEPSYPRLPAVDADGLTTVPGVYAVGEIAGTLGATRRWRGGR